MFEIGIISIIVLAVGYWVTLWLMGRHDDVLHGDFVHAEDGIEASPLPDPPFADRPPFPPKPVIKRPGLPPVVATRPAGAGPTAAKLAAAGTPPGLSRSTPSPSAPSAPSSRADRADMLQTLLASIKRDLKDASQL